MALSTIGNRQVDLPPLPEVLKKEPQLLEPLFNELYEVDSDHLDDDIPLVLALKASIDQQLQGEEEMLQQALEASRTLEGPFQSQGAGPSKLKSPSVEAQSIEMTTSPEQAQNGEPFFSSTDYDDVDELYANGPSPRGLLGRDPKHGRTSETEPEPLYVPEEFRFELNTSILPSVPPSKQSDAIKIPRPLNLAPTPAAVSVAPSLSHNISISVHPLNLISFSALNVNLLLTA
jgi:hypothetical protein